MHFQICADNLKTFIRILSEMKNGWFFPKHIDCAQEIAWPVFCPRREGAAHSSAAVYPATLCSDQATCVRWQEKAEEHLKC